ncbi:MAG TPA: transporter [Thermoanaerobaculia bacterium]|nr:transporter [Thermoanaerobaculia bacterium]
MKDVCPVGRRFPGGARSFLLLVVLSLCVCPAAAQQLEPRAYSPNPIGANFTGVTYTYQTGDVVFDASLPFSNVTANINSTAFSYIRTFGLFGRSASAGLVLPYAWGHVQGDVQEEFRQIHRSGLADMWLRSSVNLLGGPALTPAEFAKQKPSTTLGFSLFVVAPTGQYDPSKLINIGSNRWSFKPELGFTQPMGHWMFEVYTGVWFFTTNNDFFGGQTRTQEPIGTVQAHVSYTFRPRLWVAADYTYYWGGRSTVNGVLNADLLANSRFGLTLAVPITRGQSIKFAWSKGASTRIGADFSTYAVAYQFLWFDRK